MASPPESQDPGCGMLQPNRVLGQTQTYRLRRIAARMVRSVKVGITVSVNVRFTRGAERQVSALIETGCSIFAVTPHKCFLSGTLVPASQPLHLS